LYLADVSFNRVVEYQAPLSTAIAASHVFGHPDLTQNTANNGGVGANSLDGPFGLAVDTLGNLYVGDTSNHRVLKYDVPIARGLAALTVLGPSRVAARPHRLQRRLVHQR